MPTEPGWYPDPTGVPVDRYWDGAAWTEHTAASRPSPLGDTGQFPTARLPDLAGLSVPPSRPWYRRTGVLIGAVATALVLGVGIVAAVVGTPNDTVDAPPTASAYALPTDVALPSNPPSSTSPRSTAATSRVTSDGSWIMPNEVGQVLQDAQDDLQRVSGDPVFFSHSHDVIDDRSQFFDADWKVCTQNVPVGTRASVREHVDFGVVKLDESCP